jgi:hypothetical protein
MWAQAARDPNTIWDVWLMVGVLLGVVALGSWAIWKVKRWREEQAEFVSLSPREQIDRYQKMVDDGLLDPAEFAQIKAQLEGRVAPPNQPPDTSIQEK